MLVLSVLIVLALVSVVCSIFVAGAQWLLVITVGLIGVAFYCGRRGSSPTLVTNVAIGPRLGIGAQYVRVSVDPRILINEDDRHRTVSQAPPDGTSPGSDAL